MTPSECELVERMLIGYWPSPSIAPEELIVWEKTLRQYDYGRAASVIENLGESGLKWRPNVGEFLMAYRQYSIQRPAPRPELSESPSKDSIRKSWGQYLRLQLAGEVGPAESTEEMLAVLAERDIAAGLLEATAPKDGRLDYGDAF